MADLQTTFAGLKLKNPIIVSSAGITENIDKMRRCQDNGAAAVVMKSYFEEEICRKDPSPRYHLIEHDMEQEETFTFMSYEQASSWDIDRHCEEVARAVEELDIKIIPSINCITPKGWAEAAEKVAAAGAPAIELNTSCPHGSITFRGGAVEETIVDTVRVVREAVDLPLIAKISPMLTSPIGLVNGLKEIGVQGVTIFNRMTGLEIDIDEESPILHGGYAGHGGPWAIQYPLRWISEIQPQIDIDIAGSGGVTRGEDAVKYLLAGAQVVQICSVVVLNGYEVIRGIVDGIENWMDEKGHPDLASFRGSAAQKIVGTEEVDRTQTFTAYIHTETNAPCVHACPAHVPAQAYVNRIAEGDIEGALDAIRTANPFQSVCGWVCYHPCEDECTRAWLDDPIAIRALKKHVIEWGRKNAPLSEVAIEKADPTGKKVAVVGAGPAGLTTAHDLARFGHDVTVYEASEKPGGMLRWSIPKYRLPREIVDEEIAYIEQVGVNILCEQRLGQDFTMGELRSDYDAVVLAFGADKGACLEIPGEDAAGVSEALSSLKRVSRGDDVTVGKRVAVIGGGGTALDTARTALRLGAEEVFVVYRRSRDEMPINEEEIEETEEEGIHILYLATPLRVEQDGEGKVKELVLRGGYLGTAPEGQRRPPVLVDDIEYGLNVDQVLTAVSQLPDSKAVGVEEGVEFTSGGNVKVLDDFGTTSLEEVFAAGDVTGETGSVIEAIGSGRRTALRVDSFLAGEGLEEARQRWGESQMVDKKGVLEHNADRELADRVKPPRRDSSLRIKDFHPVELDYSREEAQEEAGRCFACGCGVGCGLCYRICPYDAIVLDETGTKYVVDEEECAGCGLCIERCPLGNIEAIPLEESLS
ncbi:MAG: FAD-dependent oxidoreductase [Candidatus Brocadiia bacterium]